MLQKDAIFVGRYTPARATNRFIFRFSSERLQNRPRNTELVAKKICRFLRQNEAQNLIRNTGKLIPFVFRRAISRR